MGSQTHNCQGNVGVIGFGQPKHHSKDCRFDDHMKVVCPNITLVAQATH